MKCFILSVLLSFYCWLGSAQVPADNTPMNEVKILASHNSYKKRPHPKVLRFLNKFRNKLGPDNNPDYIDYGHLTFSEQFNQYGIRGIELDVNYDPDGGHYKRRRVNLFLWGQKQRLKGNMLNQPGFKILHIADVDFESNYLTLHSALKALKAWSDTHPMHLPIYVNIEAKGAHPADESKSLQRLGFVNCIPFDSLAYLTLEAEIKAVLRADQVYRPFHFKGEHESLRARINTSGWPTLREVKGKIIFILQGSNQDIYKSFKDPVMFYYGAKNDSNTIFLLRNNPLNSEREVETLVSQFIVRTRADAGTVESRKNDFSRWNAALRSNAQIISTDYYKSDDRWSSYHVKFPNGLFELLNP